MKLYTYDPAPNPRRLTLFLQYKGIGLETQQIDLGKGEQLGDAYRAINPECSVPALILDDGTLLAEVIGICTYLEALHADKPLLGSTAKEKALVISWDHYLYNNVFAAIASILRNRSQGMVDRALPGPLNLPQIPELAERGAKQLSFQLPKLNSVLAERPWIAGDKFSFADIDLFVSIDFLAWVKVSVPEDCSHLRAWYESTKAELAIQS